MGFYSKSLPDVTSQLINKQTKTLKRKIHFLILFNTPSIEKKNNMYAELEV